MNESNGIQRLFAPQSAWRQWPGELMFMPSEGVHRFEAFSDGLSTGVIFYGPEGRA